MAAESPKGKGRLNLIGSTAVSSPVQDRYFRMRGDSHKRGFGLDGDADAKQRREFAGRFGHGDDGGAIADTEHGAGLSGVADNITGVETEGMVIHGG